MSPKTLITIAGLIALLLGAACGSDPTAPQILNLRLDPETGVAAGSTLALTVDFVDPDGDLLGGTAEVALQRQTEPRGDRFDLTLASGSAEKGTLTFSITLPTGAVPGPYNIAVTVIDRAGRRSAPLVTDFQVL